MSQVLRNIFPRHQIFSVQSRFSFLLFPTLDHSCYQLDTINIAVRRSVIRCTLWMVLFNLITKMIVYSRSFVSRSQLKMLSVSFRSFVLRSQLFENGQSRFPNVYLGLSGESAKEDGISLHFVC